MKLQSLAIIFVIIILPITIVLGEYASTQIELFRKEQLYDSRLITATDDALKAFQINTFNDATSDIADSKIESIEASVNAFYNSMKSSFGLEGYSVEELKGYVPALVYTMYDGYYIYSPYKNVAEIQTVDDAGETKTDLELNLEESAEIEYGLKPYVYYSCRYTMGTDSDFVINYALDNRITIQGIVNGESVYKSGYLVTRASSKSGKGVYKYEKLDGAVQYFYDGVKIETETNLTEYLVEKAADGSTKSVQYKYVKLNGIKYYLNEDDDDGDGVIDEYIFYILGGNRVTQASKNQNEQLFNAYKKQIEINSNGVTYYKNAWEFTKWVEDNLSNLKASNAEQGLIDKSDYLIFKNDENNKLESSNSNFNRHRKDVIRYSIESNLSVAIANFNNYTSAGANFQMPKLKETEWELLQNEVSIISFLQGLNLGGKIYNGYTVITNTKTKEVVKEENIYIPTTDGYYHKINDKHLADDDFDVTTALSGVLGLNFEIRKDGATGESYVHRKELGCYTSVISQENVNSKYDTIYEYLENEDVSIEIKKIYYTALGRERASEFKIENSSSPEEELTNKGDEYDPDDTEMVPDDLIRHLEATNANGFGESLKPEATIWVDLSDNYHGELHGKPTPTEKYVEFDGVDDWVGLGGIKEKNYTLEAKVEFIEGASYDGQYTILGNHENGGIALMVRDSKIVASAYINGAYREITYEKPIVCNTQYHIATTYDGQKLILYIYYDETYKKIEQPIVADRVGIPENETIMAVGVNPVGENPSGNYIAMKLYTVKIYNRALTESEIKDNYNFEKMVRITKVETVPPQGEWSNNGIIIEATARTYDESGIDRIQYKLFDELEWHEEKWTDKTKNVDGNIVTLKGKWVKEYANAFLQLRAIDNAGNMSDIWTITLKNDTVSPQIEKIERKGFNIIVDAIDPSVDGNYSGIAKIEYSFDKTNWITEKWDTEEPITSENKATIQGQLNIDEYLDKKIYIRVTDNAGNISETENYIEIIPPKIMDINIKVDNQTYYDGYPGITFGLKIAGVDQGYISDYSQLQDYGTEWEIYGVKVDGTDLPYTASGTTERYGTTIYIEFYTMSFDVNPKE